MIKKINLWDGEIPFFNEEYNTVENLNAPVITAYTIDDEKPHPCVVIVPGGGYTHRAEHEGEPIAKWLNERGISAFVVNYRVEPYSYPAPVVDVKRALKYVRFYSDKFNINPDKIGIMGFSAGAHVACLATEYFDEEEFPPIDEIDKTSAKPAACILCYPVITMSDEFCHQGSKERIACENSALYEKLSCEKHVRDDMPPVFIWHTFEDKSVPVRNSLEMALALNNKGIPFELHIYPKGRHGLGIVKCADVEGTNKWTESFENWLERTLM